MKSYHARNKLFLLELLFVCRNLAMAELLVPTITGMQDGNANPWSEREWDEHCTLSGVHWNRKQYAEASDR